MDGLFDLIRVVEKRMNCLRHSDPHIGRRPYSITSSSLSYFMAVEDKEFLVIYSSLVAQALFRTKILEASEKYPFMFGTGNTDDVIKAIYLVSESDINDLNNYTSHLEKFEKFKNWTLHDNFVIIIDIETHKLLRLDFLRQTKDDKSDFVGGIAHALKHFTFNRQPLSASATNKVGTVEMPYSLIDIIVDTFYFKKFKIEDEDITFENKIDDRNCVFSFFYNKQCDVYFLNTIRPTKN